MRTRFTSTVQFSEIEYKQSRSKNKNDYMIYLNTVQDLYNLEISIIMKF